MSATSEQAEDECQQWARTIRLISNRISRDQPNDVVFCRSAPSRCICMSVALSRFVRTATLKVCDEMEAKRLAAERLRESQRHLQADLRYAQEKMQLYAEKVNSVNNSGENSAATELDNQQEELLLNSKSVANSRAKALEARVESQELEIQRLRQKLQAAEKVELHRQRRQEEVFRSLKLRKPTRNSPMDNKILDIIDSYESELRQLRESRTNRSEPNGDEADDDMILHFRDDEKEEDETEASANGYRAIVEELRKQTAELSDEVHKLQAERDALSTELQSRPTNSDHVLLMSKLQRYERLLKRHCIDPSGGKEAQRKEFSSKVEHIDMLPLSLCQKHLKEVSQLLGIDDLKEMKEAVSDLLSISEAYGLVHPVLLQAEKVTQDAEAPEIPDSVRRQFGNDRFQCLVPVLDHWRSQLVLLPELRRSLQRLCLRLFPWAGADFVGNGSNVKQLIVIVDKMASDDCFDLAPSGNAPNSSAAESNAPYSMLLGIVDHFKRLFELNSVSSVLTKMNSVYAELGSTRNALNSIKDSLGMEQRSQPEAVVQAVTYLLTLERQSVNAKLQEIFSEEDVQSAIDKLEDYEEFFPVFEDLVKNLMAVLDVHRIDEILPAVTAHKRVIDAELVKNF